MTTEELIERFAFFDDWEDRYRYLIDLGKKLAPMKDEEKNEHSKVEGCMSQVWMVSHQIPGNPPTIEIVGDSDAFIVKGLIAVLLIVYSGKSAEEILAIDIDTVFQQLNLSEHISINRRNGFYAMVQRIKAIAREKAA